MAICPQGGGLSTITMPNRVSISSCVLGSTPAIKGAAMGRADMAAVIAQIKTELGAHKITISYDASSLVMAQLCKSVGFQPTRRVIDDEIEACISLQE